MEEEAGWDGDPDAKINTETGSDKRGKLGSWFLLQESQLFLARRNGPRNAAACVAWRMGPLRANRPHPFCGAAWRLHSQCLQWADPEGSSAIFLLHKSGHLEGKLREEGLRFEERYTPSLHDNHTHAAGCPLVGCESMVSVSQVPRTHLLLLRRVEGSVQGRLLRL